MKKTLFNLFVIFFITLLCSLGTWQVYRLQWKLELIEKINIGLKSEPIIYSRLIKTNYQRVKIEGKFVYDKQIYLYSLNESGKPGYDVITPLISSSNEYVLVNRGWIEKNLRESKKINNFNDIKLVGILREISKPNIFKPENDIKNNIWFSINLEDLKRFTGLAFDNHVIIIEGNSQNIPNPKKISANLSNNHLKYALTWYSLALSILFYFLYFRKKQ
ncbi:MAG: surfeit locus protein 1 [Candidatus Pelagibacter sp.]|nr:surfeit locus protein 1 [Candidatus Pelagibacter sp.]OUW23302.1 MAG: surfeit locus protein 1 [Rickettsiales bacterium TMED174]